MGLIVNTELLELADHWPSELVAAVDNMRTDVGNAAVVPARAKRLLDRYVVPLKPNLGAWANLPSRALTWAHLQRVGELMELTSKDRLSLCIGSLLIQMPDWASSARKGSSQTIYCRLCWRHTPPERRYCEQHDPQANDSAYRAARRIVYSVPNAKKVISGRQRGPKVNQLLKEVCKLRKDDYETANMSWLEVLGGSMPLGVWIKKYRPNVYRIIKGTLSSAEDLDAEKLLAILDTVDESDRVRSLEEKRFNLHRYLESSIDELYGILRRAEAWLTVYENYKVEHSHGGKRSNSGRRRVKK